MDDTGGFNVSDWSKTNLPRFSNCRLFMLYKVVKKLWAEFFAFRLWKCSGQPCKNQHSYGQMNVTAGFIRLERSRNSLGRNSNCSGRTLYGRENESGLSKSRCLWLLPFYTYPANCLVSYLLSSMVYTATVCQVYVS